MACLMSQTLIVVFEVRKSESGGVNLLVILTDRGMTPIHTVGGIPTDC